MEKIAFTMQLNPGQQAEYTRRHDAIWPEIVALLKDAGVSDYSIHLDPETDVLFAVLWRENDHGMDLLPSHAVMQKWWSFMADIMQTHDNHQPKVTELETVFHLP